MTRWITFFAMMAVLLISCSEDKGRVDYRHIDYFDGISIAKISGDWYLAKGSDKRVPIDKTYDTIPDKVTITAEHSEGGDGIMFWSIYADGLFDSGTMGLSVDTEGDFLGQKGIIGGSVFTTFLFRHDNDLLTMKVFTLVTNKEDDSKRVHVANYYKVAEQVAASDR